MFNCAKLVNDSLLTALDPARLFTVSNVEICRTVFEKANRQTDGNSKIYKRLNANILKKILLEVSKSASTFALVP